MASVTSAITIGRPIEDVFTVLTDVENTARWWPGDVEEHWTSPPPHGVGSTRHAVVRMFGRRVENDAVTTDYDPPHRAVMAGTSSNAPFVATLDFARDGTDTRVSVRTEIRLDGLVSPVGWLFARWYGRQWRRGLANLKRMMEAGEL